MPSTQVGPLKQNNKHFDFSSRVGRWLQGRDHSALNQKILSILNTCATVMTTKNCDVANVKTEHKFCATRFGFDFEFNLTLTWPSQTQVFVGETVG